MAVAAALAMTVTPAAAQHRGGSHASSSSRGASHGAAVSRSAPVYSRPSGGRVYSRGAIAAPRTVIVNRGSYGSSYYNRGYYNRGYYRPYYSFVPRLSLGIGLWAGYPVAWPSYYGYGYGYGDPYYSPDYYGYPPSYGYPSAAPQTNYNGYPSSGYPANDPGYQPNGSTYPNQPVNGGSSMSTQPGYEAAPANGSGGLSFDVNPTDASVFVDGKYMGTGAEFGPNAQPLSVTAGRHHVEIRADGYQTMSFDADVTGGQVSPYRAQLQRR
jgi:hypothetical protein